METVKVRWHRGMGQWQIQALNNSQESEWLALEKWGEDLPDLTQVRMILSASNYTCQWVNLPGVSKRHLDKALPFALEESLTEEVEDFHIVTAGHKGKAKHRVYAIKRDIMEKLIDACEIYNIQLRQLIPETSLLSKNTLVKNGDDWLFSLKGNTEGKCPAAFFSTLLESVFKEEKGIKDLSIDVFNVDLDESKLLKSQLETNFLDTFEQINLQMSDLAQVIESNIETDHADLLTGSLKVSEPKKVKQKQWWEPAVAIAAVWVVIIATVFLVESSQLKSKQKAIHKETVSLYKQLFPGERVRSLERQIKGKLSSGGSSSEAVGFIPLLHSSVSVLQQEELNKAIQWQNFRYNDRQGNLQVEITATELSRVQKYKTLLEAKGLNVEISSAVNEGQTVKGRLKISKA